MAVTENQNDDGSVFITLGVCAMAKKTKSKPMKEILRRLEKFQHIKVIVFEEKAILNHPVEAWPLCDALISFYSDGFPLQKAIAYAELRKPYLVNDLKAQYVLMNRKKVYEVLQSEGIPVPRYACVQRDDPNNPVNVIEHDDAIEIDGEIFHKPFVEKPLNAEDHNIYIYFPSSAGGGSQRLFRKVGDRSSRYFQISTIRTEGSYLYEEFMPTDGTDVKVYTVADDYAHAEARKSPALDGKVERDSEGKEIRYPVILTPREKIIAKKVAKVVKQQICGFDLLRANGMSYVCDVNGFSFVKTSRKYYDDCSHVLGVLITRVIAPRLCPTALGPWNAPGTDDDIPLVPTTCGAIMELRCVIAVFRHGDRTPKQKMKMDVRDERFFRLFNKYAGGRSLELKLKKPTQLQEVLDIVREILDDIEKGKLKNSELEEKKAKFEQLRYVLEMYGSFSGINRKIQLKYQPNGRQGDVKKKKDANKSTDDKSTVSSATPTANTTSSSSTAESKAPVETPDTSTVSTEESQTVPPSSATSSPVASADNEPCILLVVKWGGELTAAGRQQAEQLGRAFRCIYPGGDGNYGKNPGLGLLRLHSTYRHDLKIYASDEGRVQMTAAAFAKGFLALEGELPPILVQMVKSANTNGLLDNDNDCHQYQQMVKKRIKKVMSFRGPWTEEHRQTLVPTGAKSLLNAMDYVGNPTEACTKLFGYVQRLANRVAMLTASLRERRKITLYHNESWDLLLRRWGKLVKDFRSPSGEFDVSKLPDIYDNIKYDIQHNPGILIESEMLDFFSLARALADIVVPQEYGITKEEKLVISQRICTPLLRKILSDARYTDVDECTRLHAGYSKGVASPERFVRTRLYFTSESHLHSILTCLQHGGLADAATDEQWQRAMDYVSTVPELNYLSQVVIMIYEDPTVEPKTEKKFHVELHFSPGAHALCRDLPAGSGFRPGRREHNGCCCFSHTTSLLSSSTSLAETSFDSASEYAGPVSTHSPSYQLPPTPPPPPPPPPACSSVSSSTSTSAGHSRRHIAFKAPRDSQGTITTPTAKSPTVVSCGSLCIDRSLPTDLHEVGRVPESTKKGHRKSTRISRHTSTVYQPPTTASGLCYADVVNQDAVLGHRSRMHELWLDNMRKMHRQHMGSMHGKRGPERSMSTGPMVGHGATSLAHLGDMNSTWHEKTLTTLGKPLQKALRSENTGSVGSGQSARPTSANLPKTHGRFTVTSSSLGGDTPPAKTYGNPSSPSWFTDTIDIADDDDEDEDDIGTTGRGDKEVSTSHSTLDLSVPPPPEPSQTNQESVTTHSKSRHFSATIPSTEARSRRSRSGLYGGSSTPPPPTAQLSRRMSMGDQPPEFVPLLKMNSTGSGEGVNTTGGSREDAFEESSPAVTQVYTSLDSVKPDRAQELYNQGPPVAQWLMEYFDQIEKAKWSKVEDSNAGSSAQRKSRGKNHGYKPILSAAEYLKSDARASAISKQQVHHEARRGSVGQAPVASSGERASEGHLSTLPHPISYPNPLECFSKEKARKTARASASAAFFSESGADPAVGATAAAGSKETSPHEINEADAMELNALTYPNYMMQLDLKGSASPCVATSSSRKRYRGLISTAVIRGSRETYSSSVPDLVQLLNSSDSDGQSQTESDSPFVSAPQNPAEMLIPSAPSVPEIYPLETLHNAMTLHQLESFFTRLTTTKFPSPFASPRLSSGGAGVSSVPSLERVTPKASTIAPATTASTTADHVDAVPPKKPQEASADQNGVRVRSRRSVSEPGDLEPSLPHSNSVVTAVSTASTVGINKAASYPSERAV